MSEGSGNTKQQNTHKHRKPQTQHILTAKEEYLWCLTWVNGNGRGMLMAIGL